jgi:hypothetical protein
MVCNARRPARTAIATAAALLATAAFAAVPAQAELTGFGPIMPIGFPSYYEDANGLQLGLCIGDPGCPSSPSVLEPVAPNDEAFWFMGRRGGRRFQLRHGACGAGRLRGRSDVHR